ncbi:DUF4232 domain-containing protein [Streptomyces sp. CRN 30]|uniref:DUF4232 domain-containing protein n=1 Tax=Streptomyces sp. CRN 30 TaxID=3075613 RepID=UPI002A7FF198|nr:DUF4232 domain-containing protein [Streptomyces sp. CRN 30]
MRVHKLSFAALAVAVGLSLTACQDGDSAAQDGPSSAPTVSSSGDGSGSAAPDQDGGQDSGEKSPGDQGTVAGTGRTENGEVGDCRTDELEITASDNTIDGDRANTVAVELRNGGGRDCLLSGHAGVDLETDAGTLSAERTGEPADPTILENGKSVAFSISYPINDAGGSGVRVTKLLVTPPDETKSVSLDWPGAATLPVTDGTGSPVEVGPIGSAGQGG